MMHETEMWIKISLLKPRGYKECFLRPPTPTHQIFVCMSLSLINAFLSLGSIFTTFFLPFFCHQNTVNSDLRFFGFENLFFFKQFDFVQFDFFFLILHSLSSIWVWWSFGAQHVMKVNISSMTLHLKSSINLYKFLWNIFFYLFCLNSS